MIGILVGTVVWYTLLFACAGRLNWPAAWANFAIALGTLAFNGLYIGRKNPELLAQRWKRRQNVKHFDRVFRIFFVPVVFALPALAGLGVRWDWPALPAWTVWVGAALLIAGDVPIAWSMGVNPYLEAGVRIQTDRGHRVITGGPYRFVRHPMYCGVLLQQAGHAAMLGSLAAFAPAAATVCALVVRTALEDRTLQAELPGYREYSNTTRYRLVPLVW
jgi:protein-S-isoprenylcysteine O-methyltransferase Ste14